MIIQITFIFTRWLSRYIYGWNFLGIYMYLNSFQNKYILFSFIHSQVRQVTKLSLYVLWNNMAYNCIEQLDNSDMYTIWREM